MEPTIRKTLGLILSIILFPFHILRLLFTSLIPSTGQGIHNTVHTQDEENLLPDILAMKYGSHLPACYPGSFKEATQAARDDCKFLCLYVHSEIHEETDLFIREVLCSEQISSFLNDNFIFYAVDVNSRQGQILNSKLSITHYPFVGVLCNISGSQTFLTTLASMGFDTTRLRSGLNFIRTFNGFTDTPTLMYEFSNVIEQYDPILSAMRNEKEDLSVNQEIIREQDQAYLESLRRDQEKERIREEEERLQREAEEAQIVAAMNREKRLTFLTETLPTEPEKGDGVATIAIRLTNGERLTRRFLNEDPIVFLFYFIEINETSTDYRVVTHYPKKELEESHNTFESEGLTPRCQIFVEEIYE